MKQANKLLSKPTLETVVELIFFMYSSGLLRIQDFTTSASLASPTGIYHVNL